MRRLFLVCTCYWIRIRGMTNSARRLQSFLLSWEVPTNETAKRIRENGDANSRAYWYNHREAVLCLADIERFLAASETLGEDVEHYIEAIPSWYQGVFAVKTPWETVVQTGRAPAVSRSDFRLLSALAGHMDLARWPANLTDPAKATLKEALDEAQSLATASSDIGEDTKRYIVSLITEALNALQDFETFGATRIRSITMELGGAMQVVSNGINEEERAKPWRTAARKVLNAAAFGATQLAIGAGSSVIADQISR